VGVLDVSTSPPKERYAVPKDNVIKLIQPVVFDDQLTDVKRAPCPGPWPPCGAAGDRSMAIGQTPPTPGDDT
jgi:hypothetical protein